MAYTVFHESILDSDPEILDFWSSYEKKNGERKGGICLDKENIFSSVETKKGEGKYFKRERKGGKYLQ